MPGHFVGISGSFTDPGTGEQRIIRKKDSRDGWQIKQEKETPSQIASKELGRFIGQRIRERRLQLGMTMLELGQRAGIRGGNDRQIKVRINEIETASKYRNHSLGSEHSGIRLGTLFIIANALDCEMADLLPKRTMLRVA